MNLLDWFRAIFFPYPTTIGSSEKKVMQPLHNVAPTESRVALTTSEPKPIPAGRVSHDSHDTMRGVGWTMVAPPEHENYWRLQNLDVVHLDRYSPRELLLMLMDLSPDISRASFDFQRMFNPGYECKVFNLGSDEVENPKGQAHIDAFIERLRQEYGSFDVVLGRFSMGAFLGGGIVGELVLDADARESIDLVSPDPYSIRFRKRKDSLRKEVWQPGQWQGSIFVPLDIPTFKYIPVDPAPASPYGRSLAAPALFTSIFLLSMLHDVKRIIMQQGYKRITITLNTEQAMDNFSFDQQGHETLSSYIRAAITQVMDTYRQLEPDDAFVMTDMFEINTPTGTIDLDGIGAIDKMMARLEKTITRALKSNGLVMDTSNQTNETDSNRRWEIFVQGIKSIQHHTENMLEILFQLSLQAVGIQGKVRFRFSELRASEMFRDEQTRALKIQNSRNEYEAGYESQDAASVKATGHNADEKEPRKPIVDMKFQQDNNEGNEALNQGSDDRAKKWKWEVVEEE